MSAATSSKLCTRWTGAATRPDRRLDLGMTGMADENQGAAFLNIRGGVRMNLGHERTGRIKNCKIAALGLPLDRAGHAVSAENRRRSPRHLGQTFNELRAPRLQFVDHMAIMDDFMVNVDGCAILFERPLDDIDGPNHAGTKSSRLGQNHLHSESNPNISPRGS